MNEKVLTPIKIGCVEIKNRIALPSMCVFFCDEDGNMTDKMIEYAAARARGGAGLLIIPGSPHGKRGMGRPALSEDRDIEGWKKLAERIHGYGAKLFCQLHPAKLQAGRQGAIDEPSKYTKEHIEYITQSYADCALRAKKAGCDGVDVHGGHAHEIAQFLSPYYNKRDDEYGVDYKGRARLACDIIKRVKALCGEDFPLSFCLNGSDMVDGGRTIDETVKTAKLLEEAGADALQISCGMPKSEEYIAAPMDIEDMFNADDAAKVKANVNIPVIAVNRIVDISQAENIISSGKADMAAMARAQLADSEIVNKYMGKNDEPVRRCIGCNQGCRDVIKYRTICCMQNPLLGHEHEFILKEADDKTKQKRIMIAGAGPAGLEAAAALAKCGVKAEIFEKESFAGGLINIAALPPHKKNMESIISWRLKMLLKYGMRINYGIELTKELILEYAPDILIDATGSEEIIPRIEGLEECGYISADEALKGEVEGAKIAVIGGGLIGLETADYLTAQGKRATVFEMKSEVASELTKSRRTLLLDRLDDKCTKLVTDARVISAQKHGSKITLNVEAGGKMKEYEGFDAVIVAVGRKPNKALSLDKEEFEKAGIKVYVIGDAAGGGFALNAVRDGFMCAAKILGIAGA